MWENRNLFNRRFNLGLNYEDAYVSGYFGVKFNFSSSVASDILASVQKTAAIENTFNAQNFGSMLSSLCEGVTTLPGGTLNKAEIVAMGGAKWGAPTSVDFGDQVTLKFRELSGMPVRRLITGWTNLVRHTNTGASMLRTSGGSSNEYTKKNFSADLLYWTMKPNARDVEFAMNLAGVYSMSDLSSQIATDVSTVDGQTFDVNFHVDAINWDYKAREKAQSAVEAYHSGGVADYYNHK